MEGGGAADARADRRRGERGLLYLAPGRGTLRSSIRRVPHHMYVLVWDPAIARPKDLDDTLKLIEQLRSLQEKPNPKFLALAQALLADPAFAGHWGAERILDEARDCACALWEPRLPAGDGMPAMRAVIKQANALGLVAYCDARQAVMLPGDRTVTPLQKRLLDEDFEDYDARLSKRVAACR